MSSDLYSAQGVEPFLEYQSASPPVSPEHSTAGRDGYFPSAQQAETSVAWSRRKSVSSKSPSSEYPPRPIFSPSSEQPGSSPTTTSPPASPSAASATSASGSGGLSNLLRRKSSRASASSGKQGGSSNAAGPGQVVRRPSASALARKSSQQSRLTASSPSAQPMALPPSPVASRSTVGPGNVKAGQQTAVNSHPSSPPPLPALNTNFTTPAGSPPAIRGPNAMAGDLLPPPPPLTVGTSQRLSPQLEQPTPPLTPDMPSHALFQPPPTAVVNRPAPYAAVAGPPSSPAALGRGASSRRTSETSSGRVEDSLTATASSASSTVSAFGEPNGANKGKAPAAADLSNPWRSQTERPLDTVRRLSRLVDGRDLSYQANRHSSYGLAATLSSPTSGRSDDAFADSSSSSSVTPSSTPLSPWGGLPSSMSMSGPYPTAAPMAGAYPLPNRTVVTPFALDASPWPVWQTLDSGGGASDPGRNGRGGTVKRKGTAGGSKQRRQSDAGPASKAGAKGLTALQVAPTYSRSPLSQASSPEPSPPFVPSSSSAPPSIAEGRPPTLGRSKSSKRRLSFWRKGKDGEASDEKADVVPPLPASPAGIRLGKGGVRDRVVSTPSQQPQQKKQTAAMNEARSRRAASEPLVDRSSSPAPPSALVEPEPQLGSSASVAQTAPLASQSSDAKASRSTGGGLGGFLRRFATLGRKSSTAAPNKVKSVAGSAGVNELGQKTTPANGTISDSRSSTPIPSPAQPRPPPQVARTQSPVLSSLTPLSPAHHPSVGSDSAGLSSPGLSSEAGSSTQATSVTGSPQRSLALAPALPIFDGPASTAGSLASLPSPAGRTTSSPSPSPGRRLPQPPTSPERTAPMAASPEAPVELSPRADRARRMSKKLSNGSLPAEVPISPPRRLPERPVSLTTSPRQLPLPPSPSALPLESSTDGDARLAPGVAAADEQSKPAYLHQTTPDDASPATPVGRDASKSLPTPTHNALTPPSSSATDTIRFDDVVSTASAGEEPMPALTGHGHDDTDTPSHSLASTASIATPSLWEAPPVGPVGGGKPSAVEAVVSEA